VETAAALASLRGLNLDAMVRLTSEASFQAFPLLR
jgi:hypothetical protein